MTRAVTQYIYSTSFYFSHQLQWWTLMSCLLNDGNFVEIPQLLPLKSACFMNQCQNLSIGSHLSLWYLSTLHGLKMNSEAAWRIVSKIYLSFGFCDIMWFHWVDRGTQRSIRHFTEISRRGCSYFLTQKEINVLKKRLRANSGCQCDLNLDMQKNKGFLLACMMVRGESVISL